MTLQASRIMLQGSSPYAHEADAIRFAIETLPNTDPYHLWGLAELQDPSTGRLYEIDLMILGFNALYLVEVKSGPGKYRGNTQDWYRQPPGDDRLVYMENPYRLTNHKAKVLKSLLTAKLKDKQNAPWIEPLVFLSAPDVQLALKDYGEHAVITRETFKKAITFHEFNGADLRRVGSPVNVPKARDIAQAMEAIGIRKRKASMMVGSYELGDVLVDGPGFQDREAAHREHKSFTRRARTYLVSQQGDLERRRQLRRAADREAQLLNDVGAHPNVLQVSEYVTDAEIGPTVLFKAFEGAVTLDVFLRQNPELTLDDRTAIIEQIARGLAHCHRKEVIHGALNPESVLVRRMPEGNSLEVRLFNFQLGMGTDVEATAHWSALASAPWAIYQAPELRQDPLLRRPVSDVFSLGALAYRIFTGQSPGTSSVDVDRLLAKHDHLDPRGVSDGIGDVIAELICEATKRTPVSRIDNADEWIELFLENITAPAPAPAEVEISPLDARVDQLLTSGLMVERVLGQGATARVLQVYRESDSRSYALKTSLSPEHDVRLRAEAATLKKLRHPRIVQLIDELSIADRPCLLLTLGGNDTLHRYLGKEGTVSLDYAARFGEDLLSAVEYLEEQQILHRDIKPANIGIGSAARKALHLYLYDFSLADASPLDLQVGTAVYRDPYLRLRGAWDFAAERWSAAVTLHEMLTGARPRFENDDPLADDASAILAVEAIDASARGSLRTFFERALARETETRFSSAEEMRRAWIAAFEVQKEDDATVHTTDDDTEETERTEEDLSDVGPDTPVGALPISLRAQNALDRAGVVTAIDVLGLVDNRLSAIRGIGRKVAREILEFRNRWQIAHRNATASKPFFAGYRGPDTALTDIDMDPGAKASLQGAGLTSLAALAAAPGDQVKALAKRHAYDVKAVKNLLSVEVEVQKERDQPTSLDGWVDALLGKRIRKMRYPRHLFGLEGRFEGRVDATVREVADDHNVTSPAVYIAMGKARGDWESHPGISELQRLAHSVLDDAGGVTPLPEAAAAIGETLRHPGTEDVVTKAAALLRVVVEIEKSSSHGLRYVRLREGNSWLCKSDDDAQALKKLGGAADDLAGRRSVPGKGEVVRLLTDVAAGSRLGVMPPQRLVEVAAAASTSAARSARLEIYPKGISAERALALSASLLSGGLTPGVLKERVAMRYPEADALPDRPELDKLLGRHGLLWVPERGQYERPGAAMASVQPTRISSLGRHRTALPSQRMSMEPDAIAARQFDDRLREAVERRHFRVFGVRVDKARKAALLLADKVGTEALSLDAELIVAMKARIEKSGGKPPLDVVFQADRDGRHGSAWQNLLKLLRAAEQDLADRLLPAQKPLVLTQPGLLARYRLEGLLKRFVDAGRDPECAAIFLLVPAKDSSGIPPINDDMVIPGILPSQAGWVSNEWLANRHRAPAETKA